MDICELSKEDASSQSSEWLVSKAVWAEQVSKQVSKQEGEQQTPSLIGSKLVPFPNHSPTCVWTSQAQG